MRGINCQHKYQDLFRNMDLTFRKEVRPINVGSEVTRARRVFMAESGQTITLPVSLAFWGHGGIAATVKPCWAGAGKAPTVGFFSLGKLHHPLSLPAPTSRVLLAMLLHGHAWNGIGDTPSLLAAHLFQPTAPAGKNFEAWRWFKPTGSKTSFFFF